VKKPQPVFVEWEDSYGCSTEWESIDDVHPEGMRCASLGWLVYRDKKSTVIVPHIAKAGNGTQIRQGCGDMTIPTASITRLKRLKLP